MSKIHEILKNRIYYGIMEYQGKHYLGNHKPIITEELFKKVELVRTRKAHPRKRTHNFLYKGYMKCNICGCIIIASLKREKHIYYYCTNGKGQCEEHKSYLKENDLNLLMADLIKNNLEIDSDLIDLAYEAKLEKVKDNGDYIETAQNNLEKQIKILKERENSLLDTLLDKTITKEIYEQKNTEIHNKITKLKSQINKLNKQNSHNQKLTLEQTKELFLDCNNRRNEFLNAKQAEKKRSP